MCSVLLCSVLVCSCARVLLCSCAPCEHDQHDKRDQHDCDSVLVCSLCSVLLCSLCSGALCLCSLVLCACVQRDQLDWDSVLCACVLLCLCAFVLPVSMASITNATNATNTAVTLCSVLLVCSLCSCAPCKHDQHGPLCRKIWGSRQLLGTPGPALSEDLGAPGSYRGPSRTLGAEPVQHLVQYCSPCQAFTCQLLRRFLHRISTS